MSCLVFYSTLLNTLPDKTLTFLLKLSISITTIFFLIPVTSSFKDTVMALISALEGDAFLFIFFTQLDYGFPDVPFTPDRLLSFSVKDL